MSNCDCAEMRGGEEQTQVTLEVGFAPNEIKQDPVGGLQGIGAPPGPQFLICRKRLLSPRPSQSSKSRPKQLLIREVKECRSKGKAVQKIIVQA